MFAADAAGGEVKRHTSRSGTTPTGKSSSGETEASSLTTTPFVLLTLLDPFQPRGLPTSAMAIGCLEGLQIMRNNILILMILCLLLMSRWRIQFVTM